MAPTAAGKGKLENGVMRGAEIVRSMRRNVMNFAVAEVS